MIKWLTDDEKRLLFAALSREKNVCEQVDKEGCREPYEKRLVPIIKSLEQKFYYDKLFKEIEQQVKKETIEKFAELLNDTVMNDPKTTYDYREVCGLGYRVAEQLKGEN